jgi:hypothetical protein
MPNTASVSIPRDLSRSQHKTNNRVFSPVIALCQPRGQNRDETLDESTLYGLLYSFFSSMVNLIALTRYLILLRFGQIYFFYKFTRIYEYAAYPAALALTGCVPRP